MKPEWLWPAIKEAHRLGMHVHGHFPATLRPTDVIREFLHDAGVPIVAGTDGYGLEIVRELELCVQAGFSNAEALQTAT
jgi:hypothetical protein